MTHQYLDLAVLFNQLEALLTKTWVVTRHQHGISAVVRQKPFHEGKQVWCREMSAVLPGSNKRQLILLGTFLLPLPSWSPQRILDKRCVR